MRSITEQGRDAFQSDSCQCGALKRGRQEWFCRDCWAKLPDAVQKSLKYMNRDWKEKFVEAMRILSNG